MNSSVIAHALCELGQVEHLRDLGRQGPLLASAGSGSLFHCLFGRDAIRMALDLLGDFPRLASTTILTLADLQGVTDDPSGEEEPGRILHEHRDPHDRHALRLARACGWSFPYFGAVDTTPQWINLLGAYCARYGRALLDWQLVDRNGCLVTVRDSLRRALAWITRRMDDPCGGGYVWVRRAQPRGIANQVWEDSPDSHYHADGTLFDVGRAYAPVAVQGYTYDALLVGADVLAGDSDPSTFPAHSLRRRARDLRVRVLDQFWQPDLATFATALTAEPDGELRPARVVGSSAGHLLASRLLDGPDVADVREQLIARLRQPDLLAAAGIRTRSTTAARFRAGSYHNGSVWPMDTGVIADGLRRHRHAREADDLEQRILDSCAVTGDFPEFFRGEPDGRLAINVGIVDAIVDGRLNRLEQPPQATQGWTATRVWRILRRRGLVAPPSDASAWASTPALRARPRLAEPFPALRAA